MVVEEFESVALLDQIAVGIISKGDAVLGSSATSCIIREGFAVIRLKLSSTLPYGTLASVCGGVTDGVIDKRFAIVRNKPIVVVLKKNQTAEAVRKISYSLIFRNVKH